MRHIHIRQPRAGDLLGVSIKDLLEIEMGAVIQVLPKITTPRIRRSEAEQAQPAALIALGARVSSLLIDGLQEAQQTMSDDSLRLPPAVEEAMADIATVFHWPMAELRELTIPELLTWHARARARACPDEQD